MTTVFIRHTDSSPWSRPGDWQSAGHTVELVGCGGDGGGPGTKGTNARGAGNGGGGGGYAKLTYSSGTVGSTIPFKIVANNNLTGDNNTNATIWQATTLTNCNYAQAGQRGLVNSTTTATGGQGLAAGGAPAISYSAQNQTGGNGGNSTTGANFAGGGGGGGAAGPASNGAAGGGPITANYGGGGGGGANSANTGAIGSTSGGGNGGNGEGGTGGGAGKATLTGSQTDGVGGAGSDGGGGGGGAPSATTTASQNLTGGAGGTLGNATDWTQTSDSATGGVGGGGGGGGANSGNVTATCTGGAGGNFGGGGGGGGTSRGTSSNTNGGVGGAGLIVVFYSGPSTGTGTLAAQSSTTATTATSGSTGYSQAKPVLLMHCDGADGSTTFVDETEWPQGIFYAAQTGGAGGWNGYTLRTVIQTIRGSKSGPWMRIAIRSYADVTAGSLIECFVGFAGAGSEYNFDGNQVRVTFKGANGIPVLGVAQLHYSDWFYFPDDGSKKLIVSHYYANGGMALPRVDSSNANHYYHLGNTAGATLLGSLDGSNSGANYGIELIETRGHRVLPASSAQIDTAQSKFGGSSALIPASDGSYLYLDGSSDFAFGTGDFTIDLWVRIASNVSNTFIDFGPLSTGGTNYFAIAYRTDWQLLYVTDADGNILASGSLAAFPSGFHHIALTRAGGVLRLFFDGALQGSAAISTQNFAVGAQRPVIGGGGYWASGGSVDYWADEVRIIKGTAAWVENFTPPSAPYTTDGGPTAQASTISASGTVANTPRGGVPMVPAHLLLHFDGPDATTTITDSAGNHIVTAHGSAQIDTAQSVFGVSSLRLDVNGDYLSLDGAKDFAIGTGDFTVEFWLRCDSEPVVYARWVTFDDTHTNYFIIDYYGSGQIRVAAGAGGGTIIGTGTDALKYNQWHHLAVTRFNGTLRLFFDGVQKSSASDTSDYQTAASYPIIGDSAGGRSVHGWIDELRVIKGVALYTSDFAVPRAPYVTTGLLLHFDGPDGSTAIVDSSLANAALLLHFDGADGSNVFVDSSGNGHRVTPTNFAQIDTAQSRFGGSSLYLQNTSDCLVADSGLALGPNFTIECWVKPASTLTASELVVYSGSNQINLYLEYRVPRVRIGAYGDILFATTTLPTDQFTHLAWVCNSNILRIYVNGVNEGGSYDISAFPQIGDTPRIGGGNFMGWIDELRIIKGVAYTANFTPSASPYTSGGGGHPIVCNNSAEIDTAQSQFGGSSLSLPGFAASITVGTRPHDFAFGLGDFTIEFWLRYATGAEGIYLFDAGAEEAVYAPGTYPVLALTSNAIGNALYAEDGWFASAPLSTDAWHHVAWVRKAGVSMLYIDGIGQTTHGIDSHNYSIASALRIGGVTNTGGAWLDDYRIVKGYAVYGENFTPPTRQVDALIGPQAQPSTISGVGQVAWLGVGSSQSAQLLLHCDGADGSTLFIDSAGSLAGNLLLHFDGTDGSTTFTDSSAFANTITANGLAQIDTAKSKFGGASAYFNTSADYLTGDSSNFAFGLGDFTVDCWAYFASNCASKSRGCVNFGGGSMARIELRADGKIYVYPDYVKTDAPITLDAWHHIAFTRQGGVARLFLDGLKQSNEYDLSTWDFTETALRIGPWWTEFSQGACDSWLDELRIIKGAALWTVNFEPPRSQHGAGHAVTAVGNVQIDTANGKFMQAALFDGSGDYLRLDGSSDFAFGTGDFTVDFWAYTQDVSPCFIDFRSAAGQVGWFLIVDGVLRFAVDEVYQISSGVSFVRDSWHHYAVTRSGGSTRLFVDGVQHGSTYADSNNYVIGTNRPIIGAKGSNLLDNMKGWIDELRIIKGTAVWTANFTPPSVPHSTDAGLLNGSSTIVGVGGLSLPFGGWLGSLTASAKDTVPATVPVTTGAPVFVKVGDLVVVHVSQRGGITSTTVTDNLGNTYTPVSSGVDGT